MTTIPPTFHDDAHVGFQGPWRFLRRGLAGGFSSASLQLMAAWSFAAMIPAWFWARHVAGFAGHSALANHWGERIAMRDALDLWWNGKWSENPIGFLPLFSFLIFVGWALWSGWRVQTETLGTRPSFSAWFIGIWETLLIGLLPLYIIHWAVTTPLAGAGGLGIPLFSWTAFLLKPVFFFAFMMALSLQWSLFRVARLIAPQSWPRHLLHGFLRLWTHPIQWTLFALGLSLFRLLLTVGVLSLGWRWGGMGSGRVLLFALLQGVAAALLAWSLGWQARVAALFTQHDAEVRAEQLQVREAASAAVEVPLEG